MRTTCSSLRQEPTSGAYGHNSGQEKAKKVVHHALTTPEAPTWPFGECSWKSRQALILGDLGIEREFDE